MLKITYGYLKDFLDNPEKYKAYPTGSRLFNCANEKEISDYDYFISEKDWLKIGKGIENIYFEHDYEGNRFQSVHFLYNEKDYNIIVCKDEREFRCWKFATDSFCYLIKHGSKTFINAIKDKDLRVELFESFKNISYAYFDKNRLFMEYK